MAYFDLNGNPIPVPITVCPPGDSKRLGGWRMAKKIAKAEQEKKRAWWKQQQELQQYVDGQAPRPKPRPMTRYWQASNSFYSPGWHHTHPKKVDARSEAE